MNNTEEEYSVAVFEDGTREMIPKAWIQDYLKEENSDKELEVEHCITRQETPHAKPQETSNPLYSLILDTQYCDSTKKILQNLVREVTEVKDLTIKLQKGVDRLLCIASGDPEPEVNLSQPADTLSEFLAIEDHIKIKRNYDALMLNLSKIGGKTVESCTRKIWSKLCTTQLASSICWTGANGKYCLKSLTLNNLVRDAVFITHPQGKEAEIQRATMLWFSHAQDRLRARRSIPMDTRD